MADSTDPPKGLLLDDHPDPEYHCGRLLALYQHVQDIAAGDVGIRYVGSFTAACARPASVLVPLHNRVLKRLKQIARDKGVGLRVNLEKQIAHVHGKIEPPFPKSLDVREQGTFQLGYYHQKGRLTNN